MTTKSEIISGWAARITMTLLVSVMTAVTAWAAQPQKVLDECVGGLYYIHVKGWAYDPDASATSIDVHVYVYTDAGCTSRYGEIHVIKANVSRPDVNEVKHITGDHGFDADIPIADVGTYWVKVFAIDATGDGNPQIGSTSEVTVREGKTITLTAETGAVTLEDGDVLTGTGSLQTVVTIADGATVTLSGVTIIGYIADPNNLQTGHPGITCEGDANIILADGTTNSIQGGHQRAGIFVPSDYRLTISGSGSMTVTGGEMAAGIGCNYGSDCGNIYITGGIVTVTGGDYCAGIGSSRTCGNINISGGTVTATGGFHAAGIGCGESNSSCGSITITEDVVSLTATAGSRAQAIGLGYYESGSSIGSVTIGGTEVTNVPQSHFVYCPAETNSNYTVHFDKNNANASGTMADQVFTSNTPQALTPCGFIYYYDDYHYFAGWNTAADGTGYDFNDRQGIINLGDITLYAQWKATAYPISYVNAVDGTDCVTNTNPTSYTLESNDIILADPVRVGYTFDGWTYEGQDEPTKTVTIPQGSHGARTFTAHWTLSPTATIMASTRDAFIHDGQTLTGTGGKETHITIADGATVTLSGANITSIRTGNKHQWAGITCEGDATIILEGENSVKGGHHSSGIYVPEGKTLTITGGGSLNATGEYHAAGIGSGEKGSCGNIIIIGGTLNATGGNYAAGIGSGEKGSCGNITITRGVTSATATKGLSGSPQSIGAGDGGTCGTVLIGGVSGAITESPYTYTPTGNYSNAVRFDANGGTGTMDDWLFTYDGIWKSLPAITFTAPENCIFTEWNTAADGSGISYRDEQRLLDIVDMADMTLYAQWTQVVYPLTTGTGAVKVFNGGRLTGTGGEETHVTIADGATVTLSGTNITKIRTNSKHQWAGITCEGDATIILEGENSVKGGYRSSGIYVPEGKTLNITGRGSLNATGETYAAGIGSEYTSSCGNITISGGTVNATGGSNSAGIGSGYKSSCGNITISGGTVTATSGSNSAGIGSGSVGSYGNITITEGVLRVTATKKSSSDEVYIIGKAKYTDGSTCGTITISPALIDETRTIEMGYDEESGKPTYNYTRTLWGLVLADDGDNVELIGAKDGLTTDVQLRDRTLSKDGTWNTLCLPFGVTIADSPLAGADVRALTSASLANGTLTLNFTEKGTLTAIEAGTPYIIRWEKPDGYDLAPFEHDLFSPVFSGVTVSAAEPTAFSFTGGKFVGGYAPVALTTSDDLLLGSDNTLSYPPSTARQLDAFRAYLSVPAPIDLPQLKDAVLGKAEPTAASDVNGDEQTDILDITALIDYLTGHGLVKRVVSNVGLDFGY